MDRGQLGNLAMMPGLQPYSFSKDILGFLRTTASHLMCVTQTEVEGSSIMPLYWLHA